VKLVLNCETRLFQRPDDAIHRGFDKQAEADIARRTRSCQTTNRSPPARGAMVDHVVGLRPVYTADEGAAGGRGYVFARPSPAFVVCSATRGW
jgi:hypothetical protein